MHETCIVTFSAFTPEDLPSVGEKFYVTMNVASARYGNDIIRRQEEVAVADAAGLVTFTLIETDTLTADTGVQVFYTLTTQSNLLRRSFMIPAGSVAQNLFDLPQP